MKTCLLLLPLIAAAPAYAQDDCATTPNACITTADQRIAPDIIVSAGVPEQADQIGQAVTVIDRATIERRQTVAIADLLATTPGVTVSRNGGLGGLTAVRIRGAEGDQTLTLIDGVRVNDPTAPGGAFDFANLLSGSVDRVEVLRGANSVPWGSQAIGGVVNVVTMAPSEGLQARGNVEHGRYGTWFANAGVSGASGIVSGSFNTGYLRTDDFSAAASGTEPDGYRQYGATGRLEVALAGNVTFDLRGYYADSRVDSDGYAPPFYVLGDTPDYAKTQELYGYAGLNADLLGGRFHNRLAFTIADINRDNYASPAAASPASLFRGRSERYTYQGDFRVIDQLRLTAGIEHEHVRYVDRTLTATRNTSSVYGQAILTPFARLTLTGGVRYDDDSAYGRHIVWSANGAYALPTNTTFRASFSEGFRAPTLYELHAPAYGNPDLKPESAQGYDVGIEQKLVDGKIVASLTWFHRDTTNQIGFDPHTFININVDRTRAQGVEFGLNVRPTDRLTLDASYSFIDAKDRTPGPDFDTVLLRRPRQAVSVSIDWKTPIGLGLGATVQNVGATSDYDSFGDIVPLKNYALLGLRADLPVGHNFSVYARIDNVTDETYQLAAEYGTPGRSVSGGIRVKFD